MKQRASSTHRIGTSSRFLTGTTIWRRVSANITNCHPDSRLFRYYSTWKIIRGVVIKETRDYRGPAIETNSLQNVPS